MRIIALSLIIAVPMLALCQSTPERNFTKLSWLEGTWTRTNAKPGRSGSEQWIRGQTNELKGWGVSMKGADTTFVEKFSIVIKSGELYYVADVPENPKPVDFKVTFIDDVSFVCENPEHDFPKKISYKRDGNKIRAVVSGNGKEIEYLFERQK